MALIPSPSEGTRYLAKDEAGVSHDSGWDDVNGRYLDYRVTPAGIRRIISEKGVRVHIHVDNIGDHPVLILDANLNRKMAAFINTSTTVLFVGKDASVTIANGTPIQPNQPWSDDDGWEAWYGIVGSSGGFGAVRGWETA